MSKKKSSLAGLQALFARVCGLDVHKKLMVACVRILNPKDGTVQSTLRKFGTMTADLLELRQWLAEQKVTNVAMESTGVYWQPVFNLLEGHFQVWVVNAQHIKKVPGRKTDMKDAEWIAQLLQCGLLRPSFVPDRQQRELRDLTRQQTKLVQQRNAVDNRIQKVLETANIKLGSVASDVLGVSGRKMIEALIAGEKGRYRVGGSGPAPASRQDSRVAARFGRRADRASPFFVAAVARTVRLSRKGDRQRERAAGGGSAPLVSCRGRAARCDSGGGRAWG